MAKERKVRNKARDVIGDYWRTNREISLMDDEATKDQKGGPLKTSEKIWLAIIVVGLILIVLKYVVFK
ncbi:MAG: hypothetical protein RBS51_06170 [Anaerovoracaceae bacterium]|jgi:hypothetical protein|nr:hypothetical protein [Anaerovoracaceae bacterium]